MTDPIKRYRRPDQQWKCGLQDKGVLCNAGPDHLHRCANPNTDQICHPRRTLIWWRRYLPVAFASITVAVLIATANMPNYREIIAPGPLTLAHAQLISNPQDPHRCASCHLDSQASDQPISQLSDAALAKHSQSDRCISCHSRDMPHLAIRSAHDLPVEVLAEMTAWVKRRATETQSTPEPMALATGDALASLNLQKVLAKTNTLQDLACSTCHREHQGPHHDLQAIASSRCQACHQDSFKSFANGHPQFANYPSQKQSRIAFDHRKHQDSHFTKTASKFECRSCHVDNTTHSSVGQVFRSLPFETACAKCHDAAIKSSVSEGAIVFQVPSIDLAGLMKNNVIAAQSPTLQSPTLQWPEEASMMLDGKIPPLMQWLLMGQSEGSLALSGFDLDADLSKLRLDSPQDKQTLLSLVTASQMMLEKIGNFGQLAFTQKFVSSNGESNRDSNGDSADHFNSGIRAILRSAPPDLFRTAFEIWFSSSRQVGKQWKILKPGIDLSEGGWMIDKNRLSISYVPSGHADMWLASILESANDAIESDRSRPDSIQEPNDLRKVSIAKQLLSAKGIGGCAECHKDITQLNSTGNSTGNSNQTLIALHSGEQDGLEKRSVDRWRSQRVSTAMRSLTKFDHGPHLIQPQLQTCVACHSWNTEPSALVTGFGHANSRLLQHEFASIKIEQCASCHHPQAAGDNCTQCHNYHASQR